jgi:cyclohexadieny/prephenate dehydrogenase
MELIEANWWAFVLALLIGIAVAWWLFAANRRARVEFKAFDALAEDADPAQVAALVEFWRALGATVDTMNPEHHDRVLAVTSHIPHLIAYTIVGTASDLEEVTRGEVIKYSAGGFRDFTRIAASDPTMWRDVFLNNREAVLEVLDRFLTDFAMMREAIRASDGETLFDLFTRTREIRRSIVAIGQDDARADFGRKHNGDG